MLLDKYYKVSKYKQMISFPLYISFNGRSIASFQRGEGGGGEQWDLYMLVMLLFLW